MKDGKGDELWADKPNKKRHKDTDARWARKRDEAFLTYNIARFAQIFRYHPDWIKA